MTTAGGRAEAVRARPAPGRLLPLGGAGDGAWLTERAARAVLGAAAVRGVVVESLRIGLADPEEVAEHAVPPPPGALPPGPLRIETECAVASDEPIPAVAERLRAALLTASTELLDLAVTAVDLRVTELLDELPQPREADRSTGVRAAAPQGDVGHAVAAVPGVAHLTDVLGAPVGVDDRAVRVECAVAPGHRPLAVALAVRAAVTPLLPSPVPVTVLITDVPAGA
ncbi:hypothetical protein ACFU5O_27165 [Streptomyces sp. NPDC057445]|uniref:hypothetical protein n=1 Tax=Streptomyces sp. NPDC057445 TaxID=3346136 RepID=UPI00369B84A2